MTKLELSEWIAVIDKRFHFVVRELRHEDAELHQRITTLYQHIGEVRSAQSKRLNELEKLCGI